MKYFTEIMAHFTTNMCKVFFMYQIGPYFEIWNFVHILVHILGYFRAAGAERKIFTIFRVIRAGGAKIVTIFLDFLEKYIPKYFQNMYQTGTHFLVHIFPVNVYFMKIKKRMSLRSVSRN